MTQLLVLERRFLAKKLASSSWIVAFYHIVALRQDSNKKLPDAEKKKKKIKVRREGELSNSEASFFSVMIDKTSPLCLYYISFFKCDMDLLKHGATNTVSFETE